MGLNCSTDFLPEYLSVVGKSACTDIFGEAAWPQT